MRTQELLSPGERCGPYTVVRDLGQGGFGVVYLATEANGTRVALKVLPLSNRQSEALVARFQREIHLVAAITHANLVRFYGAGRYEGTKGLALWVALEFLEGTTLRDLLIDTPGGLGVQTALDYCLQIADGLGALHKLGVVHRDVKPENAMLVGASLIKVFDLGVAKVAGASHTTEHSSIGTVAYMAPEQYESKKDSVGPWTDVYAVGLMLYELATGKHPICPEDAMLGPAEMMGRALMFVPAPLGELLPSVPEEVSQLAQKAVAKKAADRFRSMSELRDALDGALMRLKLAAHSGDLAVIGGDWTPVSINPAEIAPAIVPMSSEPSTQPLPKSGSAAGQGGTLRMRQQPEVTTAAPVIIDAAPPTAPLPPMAQAQPMPQPYAQPMPHGAQAQPMPQPYGAQAQPLPYGMQAQPTAQPHFMQAPQAQPMQAVTAAPAAPIDETLSSADISAGHAVNPIGPPPSTPIVAPRARASLPARAPRPRKKPGAFVYAVASTLGGAVGFAAAAVVLGAFVLVKGALASKTQPTQAVPSQAPAASVSASGGQAKLPTVNPKGSTEGTRPSNETPVGPSSSPSAATATAAVAAASSVANAAAPPTVARPTKSSTTGMKSSPRSTGPEPSPLMKKGGI
jgi:serine/threonine protein kinase